MAQIGLVAGTVFVPEFTPYANLAGSGLGLLFLKFGRDDERQSDDLGFRYMARTGYDPTQMVEVFEMLGRVTASAGGSGIPSWLSTHPDPGERRERMQRALAESGVSGGEIGQDRYMQMIDGLVFGENPRNGFFRDALFNHPDLEFRMLFPAGWKTQNTPQAVFAMSPEEDAILQLSLGQGESVDAAAQSFLGQQGLQAGPTTRDAVNGLPATWATFSATSQDTAIRGLVVFIAYNERIFQILGYTYASKMSSYDPAFRNTMRSFDRLTDAEALGVQPKRIEIVRLDRAMTLEQFAQRYPSTTDLKTLALINDVEEGETLPAGRHLKRVVGGVLPGD